MPELSGLISAIIVTAVIATLAVDNLRIRQKNNSIMAGLVQSEINRLATKARLEETQESKELLQSDGFLRFLSESRAAAFDYIESAQSTIKEFLENSEDFIKAGAPPAEVLDSYEKLALLLPDTDGK